MSIFPGFLTIAEVAKRLRVKYPTAARYAALGYLPSRRQGQQIFIPETAVDNFTKPKAGNPNFGKPKKREKAR